MKKEEIEQYKKKKIQELECPSGLVVEISELTPYSVLKIQRELKIDPLSDSWYNADTLERLFALFMVSPTIPGDMALDDLLKIDFEFLHEKIFEQIKSKKSEETEE